MRTINLHILFNKLHDIRRRIVDLDKKWNGRIYFTPRQVIYIIDRLMEWIDKNGSEWINVKTEHTENSAIDDHPDGE